MLYIRLCDSEETAGAFIAAIEARETPSIISLSRQNLVQYPQFSRREGVQKGAYVFIDGPDSDVTLVGVGLEMEFVVDARKILVEGYGIKARVVSFPCQRLFEAQSREYERHVLGYCTAPVVVIEAYSVNGWERYADAGFCMSSFGKGLPGAAAYQFF